MTVHSNATGKHMFNTQAGKNLPDLTADFHTYGVYWGKTKIVWYFDGKRLASIATPADMHTPMYLLANMAVGGVGSWAGPVPADRRRSSSSGPTPMTGSLGSYGLRVRNNQSADI